MKCVTMGVYPLRLNLVAHALCQLYYQSSLSSTPCRLCAHACDIKMNLDVETILDSKAT